MVDDALCEADQLASGVKEFHTNLGNVYAEHGFIPEAVRQYEKALRIDPDFTPASQNLQIVTQAK